MGGTKCIWLIACLALASAIPVPGPTSEQDLLNMIRNADPKDNDIDMQQLPEDPQPLRSGPGEVEDQDPSETIISEPQEPVLQPNEPQPEEPQPELQPEELQPKEPQPEQQPEELQPEEPQPEEPQSEEPQPEELQPEPQPEELQPEPQPEELQPEPQPEELQPEPQPEKLQPEPQPEELQPEPQPEELQPEPQPEELQPEEPRPDEPLPVFVPEEYQIQIDPEEDGIFMSEEEDFQTNPEEEQSLPVNEEQVFLVPEEQLVPLEQEEEQMNLESDDQIFVVPIYEEDESSVYEEEQMFPLIEEEPIMPVYEEEGDDIERYEVIPDYEEELVMEFGNEEQMPNVEEPEDFPEVIVVGLEESELEQPISDEPIIPGFVSEETRSEAMMPPAEMQDSLLFSFMPPYFEEEPEEDTLVMPEDPQGPVYFDTFADPEPLPEEVFETPEDYMDEPVDMPVEEMPPFVIRDMSEDQGPFSDAMNSEEAGDQWFPDQVFPVTPTGYPYEDDLRITDDALVDYYIPESNFSEEDERYESPEVSFFVDGDELHELAEVMPEEMADDYDSQNFDNEFPVEEPLFIDITDPEDITYVDGTDMVMIEPTFDSETMMNDELPSQFNEGQIPIIITDNGPISAADLKDSMYMIEPQDFREDGEEPTLEIIRMDGFQQNDPYSLKVSLMKEILETKPLNSVIPNAVRQIMANEQIVPIAEFPEKQITPIIIEQESYWDPENNDQQPIIFPKDIPPRHNLPVFPHEWNEENYFQPPRIDYIHKQHPSQLNPEPSYGPPPQFPYVMEPQPMPDMANDDMAPNMPDFMHSSEFPDMPDDILANFDNDYMNEETEQFHLPIDIYHYSRTPEFPDRFNNPSTFEVPSMPDMTFQQDFHGPTTFPMNFRRHATPNYLRQNYNPYNQRIMPQNINHENIQPERVITPQSYEQGSNLPNIPNSLPNTPNMFFPMRSEPTEMIDNPSEQNMNMNLKVFRPTSMPMNSAERFNQQQQQQQFDVQVSFIPYESSYNFQPYDQQGYHEIHYLYPQQQNNFNTFQESSYSVPPYGAPDAYPATGLYQSPPIQNRYAMDYNYRGQHDRYQPFHYPTPTW